MQKPLEGLLVIAIEQAVAAPLCTARLCDAGARVIKIERPGGDFARLYDTAANGESSYFTWTNQGKESIILDFKNTQDKALLQSMIQKADVLVQNLAPGALARSGLDPVPLRTTNPRLITCDISGYGDNKALAELKAYDLLVQAETGLVEISGGPGEAGRIGISICDIGAGISAHAAILQALIARAISGKGQALKISLFDVAAEWMTVPFIHQKYGDGAPRRMGLHHPSIAPYGAYTTGDNVKTLISIQNQREWPRFCDVVMNDPEMIEHTLFQTNQTRVANRAELDKRIQLTLDGIDAKEFRHRLGSAKIAFGAINSVAELTTHKALQTQTMATSSATALELPVSPLSWPERNDLTVTGDSRSTLRRTPKAGEHTELLREEFTQSS